MGGAADLLWRWYQASPPALLGALTVIVGVGGRMAYQELKTLHKKVEVVDDKADRIDGKVDRQEILIDQHATEIDRVREARARNDRRIEQLLQQHAAAHGFDGRPAETEATTGQQQPDPSDGDST